MFGVGHNRRHWVLALCVSAVIIGYTDRVNIAVAAVAMRTQYGWSQSTKGLVLSAFAIGYLAAMALSGWLASRYGGRKVMAFAVVWWSLCTLFTPWSAAHSVIMLIGARVALGMGEAAVFPSSYQLFGRWVPRTERTRAIAALYSGVSLGQIAGLVITGWMVSRWSWPPAFYVFGAVGLLWVLLWLSFVSDDPLTDARVDSTEKSKLRDGTEVSGDSRSTPWRTLLSAPSIWAIVIANFSSNWGLYFFLAWLPSYFAEALGLSIKNAGLFAAAPWLTAMLATNLSAVAADSAIRRGRNATSVRKLTLCGGLAVCGICLILVRDVHSPATALTLVCLAAGALGLTWSGYGPNLLDVAPRHASVVAGISNTVGTIPGIVGVAAVGWIVDATGTYSAAFVLTAAVSFGGAALYLVFGSAKPLQY